MSTAVHSPTQIINLRRKKSLKKLTVNTDTSGDALPTMDGGSSAQSATRPSRINFNAGMSPKASSKRGTGGAEPPKSKDLSQLASPSTPSRSGDRKHVDNAIITKLQKLGMQEGATRPISSPVKEARTPKERPRLAVVLDMDECMLHTTSFSEGDTQRYRQEEDRPTLGRGKKNQPKTVTFKMFDGCRGTANLRPYLSWFLDKCTSTFDTYVFTAGTEAYASPLLDIVDSERKLKGRFYRTSCRRVVCELGELYLKDLSSLPVPQPLSRMVLVDNNPVSFLVQPCNGIPVVSWYDNNNDVVLKEVFEILLDISKLDDVRTKLDGMFGLKMELKALRSTVGLKNQFEPLKSLTKGKKSSLPPVTADGSNSSW